MLVNAVFEGGGVKGIGIVGAVKYLEERGYTWNRFAGTSAGAIIAALMAVGYRGSELKKILLELDYRKFQDRDSLQSLPGVGKPLSFIFEKGIYSGEYIETWINNLLMRKGKTSFGDVVLDGKSSLKIIASDITRKKMLVIPDDLINYGIDYQHFSIAKAVRMSIAIPFYFKPVKLKVKEFTSYIVDGGILSLYPIWIFDEGDVTKIPTIGFKLIEPEKLSKESVNKDLVSYGLDIIGTMMEKDDERYIRKRDFLRTIPIPTIGVRATDFNITREKSLELFKSGYDSAGKFLKG